MCMKHDETITQTVNLGLLVNAQTISLTLAYTAIFQNT